MNRLNCALLAISSVYFKFHHESCMCYHHIYSLMFCDVVVGVNDSIYKIVTFHSCNLSLKSSSSQSHIYLIRNDNIFLIKCDVARRAQIWGHSYIVVMQQCRRFLCEYHNAFYWNISVLFSLLREEFCFHRISKDEQITNNTFEHRNTLKTSSISQRKVLIVHEFW